MPKQSAGILLYRKAAHGLQVFLVHPGGPFFKNKDEGSWSVPKGEYLPDEDPLKAAKREFREETGHEITGDFIALNFIKQKGVKQYWPGLLKAILIREISKAIPLK
ncbi:NUDIX domain-containing protein [Mucilaginibacter sp. P19]|uniref:NUDIX domain-containing protein n=1 Tax=Mucilaginibacter sp. P19 TaxID=3423947 RepID=UPI003D676615